MSPPKSRNVAWSIRRRPEEPFTNFGEHKKKLREAPRNRTSIRRGEYAECYQYTSASCTPEGK